MLLVISMLAIVSCEENNETSPASISLNEEVISLVVGNEKTLTATVTPQVPNSEITWYSNKTHVVSVNGGVVRAVGAGNAKVVAQTGNSIAICEVIVTNTIVSVKGISLNKSELEMRIGDVERLIAVLNPYAATDRKVVWSSSNENIVTIQQNGTLTAKSLGEVVITAKTVDGNYVATATVAVLGKIDLLTPANEVVQLYPADETKNVMFTWRNVAGIDKYILRISKSELFEEENIVYTSETSQNSLNVSGYTLNELAKGLTGNSVSLYWTVISGTPGIRVLPEIRKLNLAPDRRDYLRLSAASAVGMQLQKMTGEYHYSITANGRATVNTVALTKKTPVDSGTVVLQYKSAQSLPSLTVNFKKSDGSVLGSITQAIGQATDWKELRLPQAELPEGWGNIGDYIQLDFGTVSNYKIELNAINLQKGVYIPEILSIDPQPGGYNNHLQMIEIRENYFKFKVVDRDPVANTLPFTRKLPANAVLLSFEYKSDKDLKNNLQIFLAPLDFSNLIYKWGGGVPKNDSGQWKEHVIDMTDTRASKLTWGKVGDFIRLDFGEELSIGMTMEIRNIQFKLKN